MPTPTAFATTTTMTAAPATLAPSPGLCEATPRGHSRRRENRRPRRCVPCGFSRFARFTVALFLLPVLLLAPGCVTNPATGKKVLSMHNPNNPASLKKEIELGTKAQVQFLKGNGGEVPDDVIVNYVRQIGHNLAAVSERPDLPWEFHVLDSQQINAFALPGGKVFMSRGLLERLTTEAQLAGVLGHEIGHVTALHLGQRMAQQVGVTALGIGLGVAGDVSDEDWLRVLGVGTAVGGNVYLLSFSRGNESEADALGVRYMTRLGYNPYGQVQVMEILKEASGSRGSSGIERMLSTHPLPQDRIDDLRELIAKNYPSASQPGAFSDNAQRFKEKVLDRLKNLPSPKHNPKAKQKAALLDAYRHHLAS